MSSPTHSPSDVAKTATILFLAGVAIVLCMVAAVYMLMILIDRYCSLNPDTGRQIDYGSVAQRAGLWGLSQDERRAILEQILIVKTYTCRQASQDDITDVDDDVENPPPNLELLVNNNVIETKDEEAKEGTHAVCDSDSQLNTTCAICLSDFVRGDAVLSGTLCLHSFHKTCAFEWLKNHDHCPCCRKEMVTPSEMCTTAEDILGQECILQMRMSGPTLELARNDFQR